MTSAVIALIAAFVGSIGAYFKWKGSSARQRRMAEEDIIAWDERRRSELSDIESAVYADDDEKTNEIVNDLMRD